MPKRFKERLEEGGQCSTKKHIQYANNTYLPQGFDIKQIILIAIIKQDSERNPDYEKYEDCYAKKQYSTEAMVAIFDLIEFGVDPNEYILPSMSNEEIIDISNTVVENIKLQEEAKEGILAKIQKMKEENLSLKNEKPIRETEIEL